VEFALISPVFFLLLAGGVDFGGVLYVKLSLDSTVAAASQYAINAASSVNATAGPGLSSNLAAIIASGHASNWADATVVVNNGPTTTVAGGTVSSGGTAANANSCYCPTTGASGLTWGSAATCGSTCASGSLAGKFVTLSANHTYSAMFANYGIIQNSSIVASATVQVQ
jgi:Flp pilus assembly protein TadG